MNPSKRYVGIDQDTSGGMTDTGRIIRDAWVFGLLPESETCAGWNSHAIEDLWITNPVNSADYQVTVLSEDAGYMTVNLEVSDPENSLTLLRISAKAKGRDYGDIREQEAVKNRTETRHQLGLIAESLRAVINSQRPI